MENIDELYDNFKKATIKSGVSSVIAIGSIALFSTASYALYKQPSIHQNAILISTGSLMLLTSTYSLKSMYDYYKAEKKYSKAKYELYKKNK